MVSAEGVGFWYGIGDGFTIFFALIGNMCGYNVNVYEVVNNGNWYNFGFYIGAFIWFVVVLIFIFFMIVMNSDDC